MQAIIQTKCNIYYNALFVSIGVVQKSNNFERDPNDKKKWGLQQSSCPLDWGHRGAPHQERTSEHYLVGLEILIMFIHFWKLLQTIKFNVLMHQR